jgi:hypothetical protein
LREWRAGGVASAWAEQRQRAHPCAPAPHSLLPVAQEQRRWQQRDVQARDFSRYSEFCARLMAAAPALASVPTLRSYVRDALPLPTSCSLSSEGSNVGRRCSRMIFGAGPMATPTQRLQHQCTGVHPRRGRALTSPSLLPIAREQRQQREARTHHFSRHSDFHALPPSRRLQHQHRRARPRWGHTPAPLSLLPISQRRQQWRKRGGAPFLVPVRWLRLPDGCSASAYVRHR